MAKPLVCTVELDKKSGVTITVKNEDGKITQTLVMDGKTIKTQIKGDKHTTLITQTEDSLTTKVSEGSKELSSVSQKKADITVKCAKYVLDAEEVTVKSSKDTSFDSKGKFSVSSTKDASVSSKAKMSLSSTSNMALSTKAQFSCSATSNATVKGNNLTLQGKMNTQIKAGMTCSMKGLKVDVKGTAQANFAAAATTVGKDLTTLKGKLTKVEGMLVKLG